MNRTRRAALATVEGLISEAVGLRLAALAATVPAEQAIVELGSYKGRSACYLAEGARGGAGAHVYAIDPWDLPGNANGVYGCAEAATRERFAQQVAAMGLADRVTQVQAYSTVAVLEWLLPIGLLFVDGSHAYTDVKADFLAWERFVQPGGWLVFDDYTSTHRNRGVKLAVDEQLRGLPEWDGWDLDTPPLLITRRRSS